MPAANAAAFPLVANPLFSDRSTGLSTTDRLTIWERAFNRGHTTPVYGAVATIAYLTSTFALADGRPSLLVGRSRTKSLVVASLLHLSLVPFTVSSGGVRPRSALLTSLRLARPAAAAMQLILIQSTNYTLMSMRKDAAAGKKSYSEAEIEPKFKTWTTMHNFRVALSTAAFVIALLCELDLFRL
jgi:hypothetical protein